MAPISIQPPSLSGLDALAGTRDARPQPGASTSFGDALGRAIAQVDALQVEGDAAADRTALGGGNLHETALALEKADTALRVATKVRNKIVDAYQEIMRMSV